MNLLYFPHSQCLCLPHLSWLPEYHEWCLLGETCVYVRGSDLIWLLECTQKSHWFTLLKLAIDWRFCNKVTIFKVFNKICKAKWRIFRIYILNSTDTLFWTIYETIWTILFKAATWYTNEESIERFTNSEWNRISYIYNRSSIFNYNLICISDVMGKSTWVY